MPPRKRAETKPELPAEDTGAAESTRPEPEEPEAEPDAAPNGDRSTETAPAKSDLQAVDLPCGDCFPNGWPALGFAVGCEHGTWTREQL